LVSNIRFILNEKRVNGKELMDALWKDTEMGRLYQQHKINAEASCSDLVNGIYIKENQPFSLVSIKFWPEQTEKRASHSELSSACESVVEFVRTNLRIEAEYSSVYKEESKKIDSHKYKKESQK